MGAFLVTLKTINAFEKFLAIDSTVEMVLSYEPYRMLDYVYF
mgnify:CR=1 FL=1